jgi:hypothetical protein
MRRLLAVAVVAFSVACGDDSPTRPENPNLSGTWTGNLESNLTPFSVQMTLSQTGETVSGNWTSPIDWNGTITGTVGTNSFTGSATLSAPNALGVGPRCTGTTSITSGSIGVVTTTLSLSGSGFTGSCTGMPQNVRFVLQKR